ncbi:MAG TPA: nicotinate-nucleotide adenylyltransferase [Acidobacteriota bacterium]|nr:nicotinate-nucleotide adenylyltransferase [Acidobacteriota bacterium]
MGAIRLGVLGGTFNPIHLGHLHVAQMAQRLFDLDRVYFVVAAAPPHKPLRNLLPLTHRYAMVTLATAGSPAFFPSLIELERPASPYSIHTLEKITRRNRGKGTRLYFIAGGDSLAEVSTWRNSERLLTSYSFIFVTRPSSGPVELTSVLPATALCRVRDLTRLPRHQARRQIRLEESSGESRVFIVDLKALDISASRIRELAFDGKPIRHLVPASVHEYLQKTHLYGER